MASTGHLRISFIIATLIYTILSAQSVLAADDNQEKACNNIDIRNTVKNFEKLNNCTVVEGFLRILLIEKALPQDYTNLSFPKLTEITGYLLLYRVSGLVSLADIFPNLAVIRGSTLFHNFAFVIFEMFHLQEIGLKSLTDILRGSLFIYKNPNLCYLQTVDWSLIMRADKEHSTIRLNKDPEKCPDTCPSHCPTNQHCQHSSSTMRTDMSCILCWNSQSCQKVCDGVCSHQNHTCNNDNPSNCCHRECLGGCTGSTASDCKACNHVFFNNMCKEKCPPGTFEYIQRRCLIEQECIAVNASEPGKKGKVYWKPIQGQCLSECPSGYTAYDSEPHKCVKCKQCPKTCTGELIDNVATAQKFKGCTVITGSLQIQVNGAANIIKELEENLQSITVITGALKVSRSFPLVSLNFLKNLKTIKGEKLERDAYTLVVMENENLQELWDWDSRNTTLEIKKGKIFFHFNAKLCYDKIIDFYKRVYGKNKELPDGNDVSNSTNGDRVACDVANLNLTMNVYAKAVIVRWESFAGKVEDRRSLLGYVVYFKEAPHQNVSIFDGRDACGTNVWKILDVEVTKNMDSKTIMLDKENQSLQRNENANVPVEICLIPHLKPFTQYALFVRTFTTASERKGARSDIRYFKTLSHTPSQPTNVEAKSLHWSNITISWRPPKEPRGVITHYLVTVTEQKDSQDYMNQRDFCMKSRQIPVIKKITPIETAVVSRHFSETLGDCCACPKKNPKLEKEEEIAIVLNNFEDFLQNNLYYKNPNSTAESLVNKTKTTRSPLDNISNTPTSPITPSTLPTAEFTYSTTPNVLNPINETSTEEPVNTQENFTYQIWAFNISVSSSERDVNQQFTKVVTGLKHFTEYSIEIRACQDTILNEPPGETKTDPRFPCSPQAFVNVRTLSLGGADDILNSSVVIKKENCSDDSIFVKWDEPLSPNSLIVSYHLEYKSEETKKIVSDCVNQYHYVESRGTLLKNIMPGKYYLRIRAMSLAGESNWTTPIEFEIEKSSHNKAGYILVSVLGVLFAIGCIVMVVGVYIYKKRFPNIPPGILYASVNPEYMSAGLVYEADEWEVPRGKITLIRELGQGSFGMVYEGKAIDMFPGQPVLKCAVKTVNESASLREQIEFLQEASIMKAFKCHHVVKLLGVVSKGNPTLVIMELMSKGDLKSYLRSLRPEEGVIPMVYPTLTLTEIYKMALQIADGMAYLVNKKYVHRDLAARNCMVDENITVKIGDFGMTRDIYETDYYRKGGRGLLPVRWMAPESLKDGVFTFHSDVWSYGVVLWEMVTLASQPYQGLSNEQVLKYVILGKQMEEPENCPPLLFELMKKCWVKVPDGRPSFMRIIEKLLPEVSDIAEFQEKSFFFNHESMDNDNGESATPTTPLKSSYDANYGNALTRQNAANRDAMERGNVQYNNFPSGSTSASECRNNSTSAQGERLSMAALSDYCTVCGRTCNGSCLTSNDDNASLVEDGNGVVVVNLNNGSKGSKVSSVSNGSLANGHLHMPSGRTTTC